jgi:cell division transport system permease protein
MVNLRARNTDDIGLRRAMPAGFLSCLVAAMTCLDVLAIAGAVSAGDFAARWQLGSAAPLTVQVERPGLSFAGSAGSGAETRLDRVGAVLRDAPGVAAVRPMDEATLRTLLRPWFGSETQLPALPLPAVIDVDQSDAPIDAAALQTRLDANIDGTLVVDHGRWVLRITRFARALEACAGAAALLITAITIMVIAGATSGALASRRAAIELLHGLGATDAFIAAAFARRTSVLSLVGALAGVTGASAVLIVVAILARPLLVASGYGGTPPLLPPAAWLPLAATPLLAGLIAFITAQAAVRLWLRRLL